mgnify:FL=1
MLTVEISHAEMRQLTGSWFMARNALKRMVEFEPEITFEQLLDTLSARGSLPKPVKESTIETARQSGASTGIVGYKVVEPTKSTRRSIGDLVYGRNVDINGRRIAEYNTGWASEV